MSDYVDRFLDFHSIKLNIGFLYQIFLNSGSTVSFSHWLRDQVDVFLDELEDFDYES